jgi:microcin C transport system substrate-binding protein
MKKYLVLAILMLLPNSTFADGVIKSHGIAIFGKLKYDKDFKNFDYVNPQAPKGGEIKISSTSAFDSLNPYIVKGNKAPGISMIFDSLMIGSLDEPQSIYGLVAENVTIAADKSFVEFEMRKNAKFHDESPMTADDIIFSFNLLKKEGDPSYRISYEPISSVEKINDYKVRFNFSDKTKRELPLIAGTMPILSKAYYSKNEFNKTTLQSPLGSGSYKVKSLEQGRNIVYERVKNYWAKDLPVAKGSYNFDIIKFDIYRDETVSLEAFKAGQYDLREENIARIWATGYESPAFEQGKFKKEVINHLVPQGMQGFIFNIRKSKFNDAKVREAISLSMDFEWMNKSLFFGAYKRNSSFFMNTDYAAKGLPSEQELKLLEPYKSELPAELFTQEFKLPITDGSGENREQLVKADKLLNEAGWIIKDGKRINNKTGEVLTLEFLFQSPVYEKVASPMRKHLKRLGIEANIRIVDDAQYIKRLETFDYDIIMTVLNRWVFFPGNEQLTYWHSSQSDQAGSNNQAGLKSKLVDELIAKITSSTTEEELKPAAQALDRVLLWQHYTIPNWYLGAFRLAYWDKFGRPETKPKYSHGFPQTWWLKTDEKK